MIKISRDIFGLGKFYRWIKIHFENLPCAINFYWKSAGGRRSLGKLYRVGGKNIALVKIGGSTGTYMWFQVILYNDNFTIK